MENGTRRFVLNNKCLIMQFKCTTVDQFGCESFIFRPNLDYSININKQAICIQWNSTIIGFKTRKKGSCLNSIFPFAFCISPTSSGKRQECSLLYQFRGTRNNFRLSIFYRNILTSFDLGHAYKGTVVGGKCGGIHRINFGRWGTQERVSSYARA